MGLVGLGGAGLAAVTRVRSGRIGLAASCGLAGLAYSALLDYSVIVGPRRSAVARSLPGDLGAAAFPSTSPTRPATSPWRCGGSPLGPTIARYRCRFDFDWRSRGGDGRWSPPRRCRRCSRSWSPWPRPARRGWRAELGAALVGARPEAPMAAFPPRPAGSAPAPRSPAGRRSAWRLPGATRSTSAPADTRRSATCAPSSKASARPGTSSARSWRSRGPASALGASVGRDLVGELRRRRSRSGSFEGQVNLTAFGILALRAARVPASAQGRSAAWLREAQNGDGGWGFQTQAGSDPDSTGAAVQGLAAAAGRSAATSRAPPSAPGPEARGRVHAGRLR